MLSVKFLFILFNGFSGEVENASVNQRTGRPSCLSHRHKNAILVKEVGNLFSVKFRRILFNGFRGEVKNVSANQRPGRPSYFSDRPERHNLGKAR